MNRILRDVFYYLYSLPFHTILLYAAALLFVWTLLNLLFTKRKSYIINYSLVLLSFIAIITYTITNRSIHHENAVRLVPLISFVNATYGTYQSLWLNAFLFFPLGLSLPYCMPEKIKHRVAGAIIISACFSVIIELTQFIFQLGLCETDDVIMNTLGAAIATLSFIFVNHIKSKHKMSERKKQQ